MFRRISGGKVQGVLSDWDSACNKETEGEYNRDEMYVGTRAFISRELHIKKPLIHYERYDYESLFYSLYWISVSYSRGKSRPAKEISWEKGRFRHWVSYMDKDISSEKSALLLSGWGENCTSFFFFPLYRSWLLPIRILLLKGYVARIKYEEAVHECLGNEREGATPYLSRAVFSEETLGGHDTFEKIYNILFQ